MQKGVEYILCSAIHFDNGKKSETHSPINIKTGFVACGARHPNCFSIVGALNPGLSMEGDRVDKGIEETQGFLTSKNRFVDRKEAMEIAFNAGQIEKRKKELYSEDLY